MKHTQLNKILWGLFGAIVAGHVAVTLLFFDTVTKISWGKNLALDAFFFEFEKNIPALFSGVILLIGARYFYEIYTQKRAENDAFTTGWKGLSYVVAFLAADEWFSIHEGLNQFGLGPFDIPYWVIIYGGLVAILALSYVKFMWALPKKTLGLLITSAVIYISGAALFESLNYQLHQFDSVIYQVYLVFEDGLEMIGVLVLIIALQDYLKTHYNRETIVFPKKATRVIGVVMILDMVITYITVMS